MKDIQTFIIESVDKENFPMSGLFKKGDDIVVFFLDNWINDENIKKIKVQKINFDTVDKVISKQLGRYDRDNHTWVYCNANGDGDPLRFELVEYGKDLYQGIIDYDYKKNYKGSDSKFCAVVMKPEMAKKILTDKPDKYDLSSINIKQAIEDCEDCK